MSSGRWTRLRGEISLRRQLRQHDPEMHGRSLWSWDALRQYFCILSGGHSWGKPHYDTLFAPLSEMWKTCWKCGSHQSVPVTTSTSNATHMTLTWRGRR